MKFLVARKITNPVEMKRRKRYLNNFLKHFGWKPRVTLDDFEPNKQKEFVLKDIQRLYDELTVYGRMKGDIKCIKLALMISLISFLNLNTHQLSKLMINSLLVTDVVADKYFISICHDKIPESHIAQIQRQSTKTGKLIIDKSLKRQVHKAATHCVVERMEISYYYYLNIKDLVANIVDMTYPDVDNDTFLTHISEAKDQLDKEKSKSLFCYEDHTGITRLFTETLSKLLKSDYTLSVSDFMRYPKTTRPGHRRFLRTTEESYFSPKDFKYVFPYFNKREQRKYNKKDKDFTNDYLACGYGDAEQHARKTKRSKNVRDFWDSETSTKCDTSKLSNINEQQFHSLVEDQGHVSPVPADSKEEQKEMMSDNSRDSLEIDTEDKDITNLLDDPTSSFTRSCLKQLCHFSR
jgi:hypothetical protein